MKRFSIFALLLIIIVSNANAAITWDGGGGDNLWNTATNWVGDVVPTSTDDVLLDNSVVSGSYTVNLPSGAITVTINSLVITPSVPNNITLIVPAANTSATAFSATGSGDAMILNNGAILKNSSGASSGTGIVISNNFRINNGGHYIHNTSRSNAGIVSQLSTATGTETGEFEYDAPTGSTIASFSNRTYGSLTFSAVANAGAASYIGSGASPLNINGNLKINSGVSLSISMSADFILHGNYNQSASSTFTLQSSTSNNFVKIMGDITSVGTITKSGSGLPTLELNGTANQNISIASITNNVSFKINNPANVTLISSLTLPHKLELTAGKIKTTSTSLLTLVDNATYTGGSPTSFVEGPMKKIGDKDFIFPVGVGSIYAPVGLSAGTGAVSDEFTAEYIRTNPQGVYGTVYAAGINHISFVEYWNVIRGASTTSQKKVLLTATALSFCKDITSTFVSHFNGTQWTNETSTSNLTGTSGLFQLGTTTTNAVVASFSPFTLATNLSFSANPLPVKLVSFNASKLSASTSLLKWEITGTNSAAVTFEVEKSNDSRIFIAIEKTNGSINSRNYTSVDKQLSKGTSFYRLKITDDDGTVSYSSIVAVINNESGILITSLWPNPVHEMIHLGITTAKSEKIQFNIIDMTGKIVKHQEANIAEGSATITIGTQQLTAGIYLLTATGSNIKVCQPFIKR